MSISRRDIISVTGYGLLASLLKSNPVLALSLGDLTNQEATGGLKAALVKGSEAAIAKLGVPGGFLNNPKVKIGLPGPVERGRGLLVMAGMGGKVEELEVAMNRAAEAAVPHAKDLLLNAVKNMSVADAKGILAGGETSVTDFFRQKTSEPLAQKFLPIAKQSISQVGLVQKYNAITEKVIPKNLMKDKDVSLERHITTQTLEGLYTMIGEEEKTIRQDPVGAGSAAISKVFGALK